MRLFELFLTETPEEDRAIVSLAADISNYIRDYETVDSDGDSWKDRDYDFDDAEFDDISEIEDDRPIKLGKIGNLFKSPLESLNGINIELQSDYGIRLRMKKEGGREIKRPEDGVIYGLWYGSTDTVVFNKDFIGSKKLKSVIAHELRHALDDFKSNYQANKVDGYYSRPKKKEHRKKDPYGANYNYLAQPAEINGRFLEVLHSLVDFMKRKSKIPNIDLRSQSFGEFKRLLKTNDIAVLFPEKERSRDYKRLIKRGVEFIDKELTHLTTKK